MDSINLAKKLNKRCEQLERELNVMLQIKTSDEDTKNGLSNEEAQECGKLLNFIIYI